LEEADVDPPRRAVARGADDEHECEQSERDEVDLPVKSRISRRVDEERHEKADAADADVQRLARERRAARIVGGDAVDRIEAVQRDSGESSSEHPVEPAEHAEPGDSRLRLAAE